METNTIKNAIIALGVTGTVIVGSYLAGSDELVCVKPQIKMYVDHSPVCIDDTYANKKATLIADYESDKKWLPIGQKKYDFESFNLPIFYEAIVEETKNGFSIEGLTDKEKIRETFINFLRK